MRIVLRLLRGTLYRVQGYDSKIILGSPISAHTLILKPTLTTPFLSCSPGFIPDRLHALRKIYVYRNVKISILKSYKLFSGSLKDYSLVYKKYRSETRRWKWNILIQKNVIRKEIMKNSQSIDLFNHNWIEKQ